MYFINGVIMSKTILLVGSGNMGFAMLQGWLKESNDLQFHVVEPSDALRERSAKAGATVWALADDLPDDFDPLLIFLAVKPQVMDKVAPPYARFANSATTFVSVAAGITINSLATHLPGATPIIRSMPNTPAAIGLGMMVSFANQHVTADIKTVVTSLLQSSGATAWIDREDLMDAVTAISGSGPAYVFHFIECLTEAAVKLGLPQDLALLMAKQTIMGAGQLAATSETNPGTLREQVTSPAGTTAAALSVFMQDGALSKLVENATLAARDRGAELGK